MTNRFSFETERASTRVQVRRAAGLALMALAYLTLPTVYILAARFAVSAGMVLRAIFAGLGLFTAAVYVRYYRRAIRLSRQLLAPSAETILERARPFVLFLRSFRDDPLPRGEPKSLLGDKLMASEGRLGARPEERLVIVASGVGPMVALGHPGDRLPPIGAARLYIGDKDWKTSVEELCRRAALVIIQAGPVTGGLLWEIENVRCFVAPEHLIVYLPMRSSGTSDRRLLEGQEFLDTYRQYFPRVLPQDLGDARCLVFDADWTPVPVGPWSFPIRSAVGVLNEDHGLVMTPAALGLDEDTISLLSAVERNYPEYRLPVELELPFDLRVHRASEVLLGLMGKVVATAALVVMLWPKAISEAQAWLSRWFQ
jgi:hypothetical protein